MTDTPDHIPDKLVPTKPLGRILEGQQALITGATSGIGRAIALAMAEAGADVAVNYLADRDNAEPVVDQARSHDVTAIAVQADVSREDDVERMVAETCRELGTIDILVNNAGIQQDAPLTEMTVEQWRRVLDVNLTGQFLCARAAVREFRRRGVHTGVCAAAGNILSISSVHDLVPWAGHVNYAASKGGAQLLMQSMAQELAPDRIRVNAISPGAIRTPINAPVWQTREAYERLLRLIPWGRIGEPEDVARAAVWLASDQADYLTGITLYVDGGMTLYPGFSTGG